MILDKTALSELTQGALRWEWDAEGFGTPLRLTPEQTDFYSRTESDFSRARASAGVCLECHTDADALSFEYCLSPGSSRDLWGFDLYLGRRLFAHTEGTLSGPHAGVWKVPLPQGEKHLRLFLPNLAVTSLRDVELTGASYAHRPIHPRRLLCFGDSITQGYATHFPSMTLANLLGLKLDAALLNQGMAGEVFYGGRTSVADFAGFGIERRAQIVERVLVGKNRDFRAFAVGQNKLDICRLPTRIDLP